MTRRAIHNLKLFNKTTANLLVQNMPFVQAGAYFPDWGYTCANKSQEAEVAHWPSFWEACLLHFNKKYPKYNPAAAKFLAFFYGVVSHGVADVSWHSIAGYSEGFIEASRILEFNGSYQDAHTNADFGGDTSFARFGSFNHFESTWDYPVDDIIQVYQSLGYHVTAFQLNTCMSLGHSVLNLNKRAGQFLFPRFASMSPLLTENYFSYHHGGVIDMSVEVARCWTLMDSWIKTGRIVQPCRTMPTPSLNLLASTHRHQYFLDKSNHWSARFSVLEFISNVVGNIADNIRKVIHNTCISLGNLNIDSMTTTLSYAELGKAMAIGDFTGDGISDFALSSPGSYAEEGRVYVYYTRLKPGDVEANSDLALKPGSSFSRFGDALTVVDFNQDGIDDLVVSAPKNGGTVYIWLGKRGLGLSAQPDISIFVGDGSTIGNHLNALDLNNDGYNDLVIGSPFFSSHNLQQSGRLSVFLSGPSKTTKTFYSLADADWELFGNHSFEWFGHSSTLSTYLFVGSPGFRKSTIISGRIQAYSLNETHRKVGEISSSVKYAKFGSSIASLLGAGYSDLIAVSSVSETSHTASRVFMNIPSLLVPLQENGYQGGVIRVLNVSRIGGVHDCDDTNIRYVSINGSLSLGHLGSTLGTMNKRLVSSEPFSNAQRGRVFLFGNDNDNICFEGPRTKLKLGKSVIEYNNFLVMSSENALNSCGDDEGYGRGQVFILDKTGLFI